MNLRIRWSAPAVSIVLALALLAGIFPAAANAAPRKVTGILVQMIGDPGTTDGSFDSSHRDAGGVDLVLVAKGGKAYNVLATTPEDLQILLQISKGKRNRKRRITLQLQKPRFRKPRPRNEATAEEAAWESDALMITKVRDAGHARISRERTARWAEAFSDETLRLQEEILAIAGVPPTAAFTTRKILPVYVNLPSCPVAQYPNFKGKVEDAYRDWIQASNPNMFGDTWNVSDPLTVNVNFPCTGACNPANIHTIAAGADQQLSLAGVNHGAMYRKLYILPGNCPFSGFAEGGNINDGPKKSWYWRSSYSFQLPHPDSVSFLIAHELGHNFGFEHSSVGSVTANQNYGTIGTSTQSEYRDGFLMGNPQPPNTFRYTYRGTHLMKTANSLLPSRALFDLRSFNPPVCKFQIKMRDIKGPIANTNTLNPLDASNVFQGAVLVPPGVPDPEAASMTMYRDGNKLIVSPRLPNQPAMINDYPYQDFPSGNGGTYTAPNGAWKATVVSSSGNESVVEIERILADFDGDDHLNKIACNPDGSANLNNGQLQHETPIIAGQDPCPTGGSGAACNQPPGTTTPTSCGPDEDRDGVRDCEDCCPPPTPVPTPGPGTPAPPAAPTANTFNPYSWCTNINRSDPNAPAGDIRQLCGGQDCRICNPSAPTPVPIPSFSPPGALCEVNCDQDSFIDARGPMTSGGKCNLTTFGEDNCTIFEDVGTTGGSFSDVDPATICQQLSVSLPQGKTPLHYANDDQVRRPCPRANPGTPSPGTFTPTPTPSNTPTNTPTETATIPSGL